MSTAFLFLLINGLLKRALQRSLMLLLATALFWAGWLTLAPQGEWWYLLPGHAVWLSLAVFLFPFSRIHSMKVRQTGEQVDERDVMFAREEYQPGTEKYEHYYAMRPENKEIDDRIRKLPPLLDPGGRFYDPQASEEIKDTFREIAALTTKVDGGVNPKRLDLGPAEATRKWKEWVRRRGADEVGVARMHPSWVYSHVGRGPEPWGQPINNSHRFAIVYTVEMDFESVDSAPSLPITQEAARRYFQAAEMSVEMARLIRELGYSARAHISDSNYQIMLPPVAWAAGLGEIGRMGYLVTPRLGPRVRLGAVTTDLPLVPDRPIVFGVQEFCEICKKCATNCPSAAIPNDSKTVVRGVEKWPINVEQCIRYWRVVAQLHSQGIDAFIDRAATVCLGRRSPVWAKD